MTLPYKGAITENATISTMYNNINKNRTVFKKNMN